MSCIPAKTNEQFDVFCQSAHSYIDPGMIAAAGYSDHLDTMTKLA